MARQPEPIRLTVTRYLDAKGRQVPKGTPGARKVTTKTEEYYARVGTKMNGKRKPIPLRTTDKATAWEALRKLLRQQREEALGIRDPFTDAAELSWEQHVKDWLDSLVAKGTSEEEIRLKRGRLAHLRELAGWKRITDIDEDSAIVALAKIQHTPAPGKKKSRGAQTRNHYRAHLKQLTRWLKRRRRLRDDPLDGLARVSVETDRRHDRRCPTDLEVQALLAEVDRDDAPLRRGLTGSCRALLYRTAMATGFRFGELRKLTRESFRLEEGCVVGRAAYSKNKKESRQQLPAWLVDELRAWLASGGSLWEALPRQFPGRVLKADLKRCKVPWKIEVDDVPLFFDAHALRVWYISFAASLPGISPKTLMEMARHSDPRLTLKTYAKAKPEQVRAALAQMPRPGAEKVVAPEVAPKKRTPRKRK